ncbi:hypothetical protein H6CHR_03202 [Variovorax sp. PBL-H6]|uniref:hypothetical protein n=1 Tax=Variovorax sp. PBL-H6 TaxID=434009 RepID=UPI001318733A|nr:hypothetical protein [Variovorax sp. PBL-H6]VTU29473.1 hypothetical protein H6CHR_03202 [Variovorax sp. PBL-H6]
MAHISKNPRYAEATKEYEALGVALGKVEGRIAEIEALMRARAPDPESAHVAAALEFATTGKVKSADNTPTALSEEHLVLRQQREALNNALRIRREAMQHIAGELSVEACAAQEKAHRELAARYAAKLKELDALYEEEIALISSIEAEGFTANFRNYIQWPHIGRLRMGHESAIFVHLRDISRYAQD